MQLMKLTSISRFLPRVLRDKLKVPWNLSLQWEQGFKEWCFYKQFVRKDSLVFDIGANIGLKSAAFIGLGARVIACEPNPVCVEILERRFRRAIRRGQMTVIPKAVSDQSEVIKLNQFWDGGGNSSASSKFSDYLEEAMGPPTAVYHVETIAGGELFQRFGCPDFIKVDVEGMDAEVLSTFPVRSSALSFEYNIAPEVIEVTHKCFSEVNRLGFTEGNYTPSTSTRFGTSKWLAVGELLGHIQTSSSLNGKWGDIIVR